ncbi:amino acid adenylation domain-containing protein [Streptomyces sp. NPDC056337]|uniref:amino acid adenylation domain-containing protein n=1 Tax=Streptomyces sp. NPDC056337 TaxID=3345787 RepID=UPI0035E357F9
MIHQLVERQATLNPQALALVDGTERITYGQLHIRAAESAARLRSSGVRRGSITGVCMERSADMVVTLLGVLQCGASYVMLDPALPPDRLRQMTNDADISIVIHSPQDGTAQQLDNHLTLIPALGAGLPTPLQEAAPAGSGDDNTLACLMFTSGTTGRPKGIAASHRAVVSTLTGQDYAGFGPGTVWLQCAPLSWDAFALELWGPLINGGTCVLYPDARPDPLRMRHLIAEHEVTDLYLSGSLFNVIVDEFPQTLQGVRRLTVGGETLSPRHVTAVLGHHPDLQLRNGYGPVEGMVFLTTHPVSTPPGNQAVPIGRPLQHKHVYLLDQDLRPVPDATIGELYAAGAGLAHGYAGQPSHTAERFVPNPFGPPGERMYRTGDRARRRTDGILEFVGRADDQLKLRGFRVEPTEIEGVLAQHPAVDRAAVAPRVGGAGHRELVAFLVPNDGHRLTTESVRRHCQTVLPDYMRPSAFTAIQALPLLPNGKLDRAALTTVDLPPTAQPIVSIEETLVSLFAEALEVTHVDAHDDFFEFGGHSLSGVKLLGRIQAELSAELTMRTLLENPTAATLAPLIPESTEPTAQASAPPRPDTLPLSPAQRRLWFLDRIDAGAAYNVPILARIAGALDVSRLQSALAAVATRHEPLRTVFQQNHDGEPTQHIREAGTAQPQLTFIHVPAQTLEQRITEAAQHRFDLTKELPWHAVLFEDPAEPNQHTLLLVLHHIAIDGWSLAPLLADLSRAYAGEPLAPLPLQYTDHTLRQQQRLGPARNPTALTANQLTFWRKALHGLPSAPALPRRPESSTIGAGAEAATVVRRLDADTHARLIQLGREHSATLFTVLHAAAAAVLDRAGPGEDIAIGTPVAARNAAQDTSDIIGFFVNFLVLRTGPLGDPSVAELLTRVREVDLNSLAHQDVPFEQVVEELRPPRLAGHHPFTDVVLALQNNASSALRLPGADCHVEVVRTGAARFQLLIDVTDSYDMAGGPVGLTLTIEYQQDVFNPAAIDWLANALTHLLTLMPDAPHHRLSQLVLPTPPIRSTRPTRTPPLRPKAGTDTPLSRQIAAVFAQVLGVPGVDPQEDFFALGGNSLRAVTAAARLATTKNLTVTTSQIFENPTPAALAAELEQRTTQTPPTDRIPRQPRIPRKENPAP